MKDFEKIQPEERSGQHVPDGKRESGGKVFPKPTIQLSPFVHVIEPLTPQGVYAVEKQLRLKSWGFQTRRCLWQSWQCVRTRLSENGGDERTCYGLFRQLGHMYRLAGVKPPFHLRMALKIQADSVEHLEFLVSEIAP